VIQLLEDSFDGLEKMNQAFAGVRRAESGARETRGFQAAIAKWSRLISNREKRFRI
jgi:hypothetical protein